MHNATHDVWCGGGWARKNFVRPFPLPNIATLLITVFVLYKKHTAHSFLYRAKAVVALALNDQNGAEHYDLVDSLADTRH